MLRKLLILSLGLVLILCTTAVAKGKQELSRIEGAQPVTQPGTTLDYCQLSKTCIVPAYYYQGWQTGERIVTYYDPAVACPAPTYPLEITTLWITLLDDGTLPFPVQVDLVVFDMAAPGDPCQGPGAELCRETFVCDAATYQYPNLGPLTYSAPCCVNAPVYIGIEYSDPGTNLTSILIDDGSTCPAVSCDHWYFTGGAWNEWVAYWGSGTGPPIYLVDVETNSPNCQEVCPNHKMHYPQLPDPNGWDVNCTGNTILPNSIMLADDFRCSETGYFEDIHFWGSWKNDIEGQVVMFQLAIHENIPVGPHGYSEPGAELWFTEIFETDYTVTQVDPPGDQGWYDPITGEVSEHNHQFYYRYDVIFPPGIGFYQEQGQIYWLRIVAFVADPENTAWGWKTSMSPQFMDDAVYDSYLEPTGWRELYDPMPEPPIVNQFWVSFGPGGELIDGGGEDAYGEGWYYYPSTSWWNIWFYDHPLARGMKHIHVEFDAFGPGVQSAIFAFNWSTDLWDVPGEPPLPGVDENLYIGRAEFQIVEGRNVFDWDIPEYNPEWVSIDFRVYDVMDIPWGFIDHQCIPSLDLAFCITSEAEPTGACCDDETGDCLDNVLQSDCPPPLRFAPFTLCADMEPPCEPPIPIPTLSEWGILILALLLLSAGTIAVIRKRREVIARTK